MSLPETLGVLFGLFSVYYAARDDILTWPATLLNVSLFAIWFWGHGLYINVGLQVFYFLYGVYGWWVWARGGAGRQPRRMGLTPDTAWAPLSVLVGAGTLGLGAVFDLATDNPFPYWDAATVALSVAAQFMLTQKWLENWWVWLPANTIYIYLALSSEPPGYLFAGLQLVYIGLSIAGYAHWRRALGLAQPADPAARPPEALTPPASPPPAE